MVKNYFKIAWRNLLKNRQFTVLNLLGLSTGIACALLIYLWVSDELGFDKFHQKDARLFQVMQNIPTPTDIMTVEGTPGPLAASLVAEIPEIEQSVAVRPGFNKGIISSNHQFLKANEQYAGKDFFNVFSYHLLEGDKNQMLAYKGNIVLSDELALKLFNSVQNIVGKTIKWDHSEFSGTYTITGVFEKLPANSSSQFDILFSYDLFLDKRPQFREWGNSNPNTYIVLKEGANVDFLNKKLLGYIKTKSKESTNGLFLRKYSDQYLYGKYENGIQTGGRIEYVRLFSIIALFILVIACINFMNLSTAKASQRLKEVGIKKVAGASRGSLIAQYLSESLMTSFLSLILALVMVLLFLPQFNLITGKHLALIADNTLVPFLLCIVLVTGLISGSYPAFYLSGFKPVVVLKGKLRASAGEVFVRKGLVVFQFTFSVIFIISVAIVYKQMGLIQTKNLGYNKENIIYFEKKGKVAENMETFLTELKRIPGVVSASNMGYDFTGGFGFTSGVSWEGKNAGEKIEFGNMAIGYDLIETIGYKIKEGRSFSRAFGSDSSALIMNESAIKVMGLKEPIGKSIELWGENRTIVGVVQDFNFQSLYENVKPSFIRLAPDADKMVIKIQANNQAETISQVENFYKSYTQGLPFDFKFLDQAYEAQYAAEKRVAILSGYFAGLAIIISCLGLFGLAAFTAQTRQKEIGIRKVVGASVNNLVIILLKDFIKLVLIAVLVASPIAWWSLHNWLQSFAFHVEIQWWLFAVAGGIAILIAILTISFNAIRAALVNPVTSLRTE